MSSPAEIELRHRLAEIMRSVLTHPATIESMVDEAMRLVPSDGTGRVALTIDFQQARSAEVVATGTPSGRSIPHAPRVRHVVRPPSSSPPADGPAPGGPAVTP